MGGRYFENCNEAEIIDRNPFEDGYPVSGVARYALDPDNASLLWEISTNLTRR